MTEPVLVNTPSTIKTPEAPPATLADRLREVLETVQRLHGDAEWLQIDADGLLSDLKDIVEDLKDIVEDPVAHNNAALAAALDAATWLHGAAENVEAEFSTLIDHLHDATEA